MKKSKPSVLAAIEPFVLEENIPSVMEMLYPMLSYRGKQEVKSYWKQNDATITPKTFELICEVAKEVTGVDIRTIQGRNKKNTLAQFFVSFALYHEFVALKKITLKGLCQQYMPAIKHSQILYAVNAVEKSVHLETAFDLLNKFTTELASRGFVCSRQRLIVLKLQLSKAQTNGAEPTGTNG